MREQPLRMTNQTWHILGPGAIGSLFAWHLKTAGLTPLLITRSPCEDARLIALEKNGQIQTQAFHIDKSQRPIDQLLVTVKAHQTNKALSAVQNRIHSDTLIVLLQNGMGTWHIVEELFPGQPCLLATTTEGAHRAKTDHVIHAGRGHTWMGALKSDFLEDARRCTQQWNPSGSNITFDGAILQRLWLKLAINCAINPLTVLFDCKNGELLKKKAALEQIEAVCLEVDQVMSHCLNQPVSSTLSLVQGVAKTTANNVSSMLQDYRQGQPTEIDFITGYLLQEANRFDIPAPINQDILDTIHQMTF